MIFLRIILIAFFLSYMSQNIQHNSLLKGLFTLLLRFMFSIEEKI